MYIKPINDQHDICEAIIEQEWDNIAEIRDRIIRDGKDISLLDVTEPFIMENIGKIFGNKSKHILDCGCGTGHLSNLVFQKLKKKVTAIDISGKSIHAAKNNYGDFNKNLTFIKASIKDHEKSKNKYDMCIANMVLMDVIDLTLNLQSIYHMTVSGGYFCFTITHPWFWPVYWNYNNEPWFNYDSEIYIKAPFKISDYLIGGETTHIHRSFTKYFEACSQAGFEIINIKELYPRSSHLVLNYRYEYPRFMGFVCKKK